MALLVNESRRVQWGNAVRLLHQDTLLFDQTPRRLWQAETKSVVLSEDLNRRTVSKMELFAQTFRDDQPPGSINGSFHGKMVNEMVITSQREFCGHP